MAKETNNNLEIAKNLIWNRRYKAWRTWFYAFVIVTVCCVFKDSMEIFKLYAQWSTLGLVALIGGLSATDFIEIKKNGG